MEQAGSRSGTGNGRAGAVRRPGRQRPRLPGKIFSRWRRTRTPESYANFRIATARPIIAESQEGRKVTTDSQKVACVRLTGSQCRLMGRAVIAVRPNRAGRSRCNGSELEIVPVAAASPRTMPGGSLSVSVNVSSPSSRAVVRTRRRRVRAPVK